ncbi:MAG TPA: glucoamylase family protein, partial [Pyrinomonadaceae bacterium]|nr:glucoamylase family protein [Pyrinomonadaceae bacterium]
PRAWLGWTRKRISYAGFTFMSDGPLFIHQYTQLWADLRGARESRYPFTDYFANSVAATRAHRQFCIDLASEFPGYGPDVWGITASDSAKGYVAWGGPPRDPAIDGTVVPSAAGGSLMFTPDISVSALRAMKEKFGERVYGRYGFTDAFNPNNGWVNPDVIGINQGPILLGAENLRSGFVWKYFMRNGEIMRAMRLVGLRRAGKR